MVGKCLEDSSSILEGVPGKDVPPIEVSNHEGSDGAAEGLNTWANLAVLGTIIPVRMVTVVDFCSEIFLIS